MKSLPAMAPRNTCAIAAVAMAAAAVAWRLIIFNGFTNDQYVHLALAQQLLLGELPVRDFNDPGMPLLYLLSAGAMRLWPESVGAEWIVTTAGFAGGAAATVVAASRLAGSVAIGVVVTALLIALTPRDYSYPKVLIYAMAGAALVWVARRPSPRRVAWLGALVAIGFLFRHDHGVYAGAAALVAVAMSGIGDRGSGIRNAVVLASATAAVLAPWLIYILLNDPVGYVTRGMEFARAEAEVTVLDALPRFAAAVPFTRENGAAWLFWLFWLAPAACAVVTIRHRLRGKERWHGEAAAVLAIAVLAAGVNAGFLRDVLAVRIPDAAVPAALLGAWLLGLTRRPAAGLRRAIAWLAVGITAAAIYSVAQVGEHLERARSGRAVGFLRSSHREMAPSRFSHALIPFFEYMDRCTMVSDRVMVTGLFPDIPVLARRGFAGGSIALALGHASPHRQDEIVERLRRAPPRFVFLLDSAAGFAERFEKIARHLDADFELLTEWPVPEAGSIAILVQRRDVGLKTPARPSCSLPLPPRPQGPPLPPSPPTPDTPARR